MWVAQCPRELSGENFIFHQQLNMSLSLDYSASECCCQEWELAGLSRLATSPKYRRRWLCSLVTCVRYVVQQHLLSTRFFLFSYDYQSKAITSQALNVRPVSTHSKTFAFFLDDSANEVIALGGGSVDCSDMYTLLTIKVLPDIVGIGVGIQLSLKLF